MTRTRTQTLSSVARVLITKGRTGRLRIHAFGANNEEMLISQPYRDHHVDRLALRAHAMFPDARVFVRYSYKDGSRAQYEVSFDGEAVKIADQPTRFTSST